MTATIETDVLPVVTYRRANVIVPAWGDNGYMLLDQQANHLTIYACTHDIHIVDDFSDNASGLSTDREGLRQLLDALAAGPAQAVLVYSIDRISRSLTDIIYFARTLKELGAGLITVEGGPVDLDAFLRDTPAWLVGKPHDPTPDTQEED